MNKANHASSLYHPQDWASLGQGHALFLLSIPIVKHNAHIEQIMFVA